jgi:replicative DNA helicase
MNPKNTFPHSIDAECSVIGGLLIDNQAWDVIVEILTSEDFYIKANSIIFKVLENLSLGGKPFDFLTVIDALTNSGEISNIGGESYLYEIAHKTPSAANVKHYAKIVKENSLKRQCIKIANNVIEESSKGITSSELIEKAEGEIFKLSYSQNLKNKDSQKIGNILPATLAKIDAITKMGGAITGISTGFRDLDNITSGLQRGELIIIAGRPSMGKTTFAMNIAENMAISGDKKTILIFSMEMPAEALSMRMLSSLGKINHQNLRQGKLNDSDWASINFVYKKLNETNLFINDLSSLTPLELRSFSRRVARDQNKLDLIVVDYLQLMRLPNFKGNKVDEITEITRSLKAIAKELSVPLIALSQLNRDVEKRNDRRPVSSDLRDSGSIEQDADLIALIYRDEFYHPETLDKGLAEIIITKQRNGPIDKIKLRFLGQFLRFENYSSSRY